MPATPTIDVLIPHFNDSAGLFLSLRSIQQQTWGGKFRVVICDDGSRSEQRELAEEVAGRFDLSVEFIHNDRNRGRPYTRNVLLDAIESPFVAWLDAGDEWYKDKTAVQMGSLEALPVSARNETWVTCNYDWLWAEGRPKLQRQKVSTDQVREILVGRVLRAYLWTIISTAEAMRKPGYFDENLPRLQDLDFFVRFLLRGGKLALPEDGRALCVYHKSDVGRNATEIARCYGHVFNTHRRVYAMYGGRFVRGRRFEAALTCARFAKNNNDRQLTTQYVARAFIEKPESFAKRLVMRPRHFI